MWAYGRRGRVERVLGEPSAEGWRRQIQGGLGLSLPKEVAAQAKEEQAAQPDEDQGCGYADPHEGVLRPGKDGLLNAVLGIALHDGVLLMEGFQDTHAPPTGLLFTTQPQRISGRPFAAED